MRPSTPHGCPHCHCQWDTNDDAGRVDRSAPFYSLVELIDNADPPAKWERPRQPDGQFMEAH